jgi:glycosyltransferase involved in cell wall biosynthesis
MADAPQSQTPPLVTLGIPLFRSKRFLAHIIENLENLDYPNLEIIISDRHCHDDALALLEARYGKDPRFRFFAGSDERDWVANFNFLLAKGSGKYFRWMPHDDSYPVCNLREMVNHLERTADTVIIFGPTQTIDLEGRARWIQTEPRPGANPAWTFDIPLLFNFDDYFNGAFKGLFRRQAVAANNLSIQPTYRLQYSERCWLFAMSLLGKFHFMESYQYLKRVYPDSTHAQWRPSVRNIFSQFVTMHRYLWRLERGWRRRLLGSACLLLLTCRKMLLTALPAGTNSIAGDRANRIPERSRERLSHWVRRLSGAPVTFNTMDGS